MPYEESELKEKTESSVPNPDKGIGTRISEISEMMGGRKKAAKMAGVALSTFHRWLAGDSIPALDSIARLAQGAGVSLDWVATGEGPKELGHSPSIPNTEVVGMEDYAFVPLYDAQCSAGAGAWNENCRVLTHISFTRYSLRKQGLTPDHLSAIRIDGDSMEPVLHSGDTVLIDHTRTTIEGEGIYILRLDGHLYAKRLQRNFDGVSVISANSAYDKVTVPRDRLHELEIVGRAVWSAGWL
ncbi:MAG: helix-turn-helix transcriptional regulator [Halomonas sp.]|nr:helix-turn-helix transcriptional regulator [Halomonas sp.]